MCYILIDAMYNLKLNFIFDISSESYSKDKLPLKKVQDMMGTHNNIIDFFFKMTSLFLNSLQGGQTMVFVLYANWYVLVAIISTAVISFEICLNGKCRLK